MKIISGCWSVTSIAQRMSLGPFSNQLRKREWWTAERASTRSSSWVINLFHGTATVYQLRRDCLDRDNSSQRMDRRGVAHLDAFESANSSLRAGVCQTSISPSRRRVYLSPTSFHAGPEHNCIRAIQFGHTLGSTTLGGGSARLRPNPQFAYGAVKYQINDWGTWSSADLHLSLTPMGGRARQVGVDRGLARWC